LLSVYDIQIGYLLLVGKRGDIDWLGGAGRQTEGLRLLATDERLRVARVDVEREARGQFLRQQQREIRQPVEKLAPLVTDVHAQIVVALFYFHKVLKQKQTGF